MSLEMICMDSETQTETKLTKTIRTTLFLVDLNNAQWSEIGRNPEETKILSILELSK
jgi:hypothetical protein